MRRVWSPVLTVLLLLLLAASLYGEFHVLPNGIEKTAATFPEVRPLTPAALAWGIVALTCCQAILVIGLRLVSLARDHDAFAASAFGWFRAVAGVLLFLAAWSVGAIVLLSVYGYSSPLMFLLGVAAVAQSIAGVSLAMSRATRRPQRVAPTGRAAAVSAA